MKATVIKRLNKRNFASAEGNIPLPNPHEPGDIINVVEEVKGTFHGYPPNNCWLKTDKGYFVWSGGVKPSTLLLKNQKVSEESQTLMFSTMSALNFGHEVESQNNLPKNLGQGVTIFILDSGIDESNIEICKKVKHHFDEVILSSLTNPHGTQVASCLVDERSEILGLVPKAELVSFKVINNENFVKDSAVIDALSKIREIIHPNERCIVNMSLKISNNENNFNKIDTLIQDLINRYNVLFICAGTENGLPISTSRLRNVISVGVQNDISEIISKDVQYYFWNATFQTSGLDNSIKEFHDSSAYTAILSGIVARLISANTEKLSLQKIKNILNSNSELVNTPGIIKRKFKLYRT